MDEVVKWLMLVIVVGFDPLAVALTIGFNVAVNSDRLRPAHAMAHGHGATMAGGPGPGVGGTDPNAPAGPQIPTAVGVGVGVILAVSVLGGAIYFVAHSMHQTEATGHSSLVPSDSFAVVSFRPPVLRDSGNGAGGGRPRHRPWAA